MNESVVKKAKVTEEIKQATVEDYNEDSSPEFDNGDKLEKTKKKRTTLNMGAFVAELSRYSCADRCGAALWNSAVKCLTDAGYLQNYDQDESLDDNLKADKSKIKEPSFLLKRKKEKMKST